MTHEDQQAVLRAHLNDVMQRLDRRKVSRETSHRFMLASHVGFMARLYGERQPSATLLYTKIAVKDHHTLIVYYEKGKDAFHFGALPYSKEGYKLCLKEMTVDDVISWLAPTAEELTKYRKQLFDDTDKLTFDH